LAISKVKEALMRNLILSLLFVLFLISVSGCQTVKNTAAGLAVGAGATACGFGKGLADDTYNTWKAVEKADNWFKENYW
jgi:uncharacterized protein YceK